MEKQIPYSMDMSMAAFHNLGKLGKLELASQVVKEFGADA